jgi:hypothetical protein
VKYKIVRIEDGAIVETNLTNEEADNRNFFYDTEAQPHCVVPESDNSRTNWEQQ